MLNFNNLLDEDEIDVPVIKDIKTVTAKESKKKEDDSDIEGEGSKELEEDSKKIEEVSKEVEGDDSGTTEDKTKKSKKGKKASGSVDEVLESLMNKKETARLGLTVNKEIYDKLKTLSMKSSKSVTKVVSELLTASLAKIEIDYELVEAFDENFKEKRKK